MPKFKSHFKREETTKCVGFGRKKKPSPYLQREAKGSGSFEVVYFIMER